MSGNLSRPLLVRHARLRWDDRRGQHQLVFPEGMLVLNESGAAIVRLCDGRTVAELVAALSQSFSDVPLAGDVTVFLDRLAQKGLLRDANT